MSARLDSLILSTGSQILPPIPTDNDALVCFALDGPNCDSVKAVIPKVMPFLLIGDPHRCRSRRRQSPLSSPFAVTVNLLWNSCIGNASQYPLAQLITGLSQSHRRILQCGSNDGHHRFRFPTFRALTECKGLHIPTSSHHCYSSASSVCYLQPPLTTTRRSESSIERIATHIYQGSTFIPLIDTHSNEELASSDLTT